MCAGQIEISDVLHLNFGGNAASVGHDPAVGLGQQRRYGIALDAFRGTARGNRHQIAADAAAQIAHHFLAGEPAGLIGGYHVVSRLLKAEPRKKHLIGRGELLPSPPPQRRLFDEQVNSRGAQVFPQ